MSEILIKFRKNSNHVKDENLLAASCLMRFLFMVRYELEEITFTDYNKLLLCSKKIEFSLGESI